ncbi:MAG: fused response regulator/phosphatase [Chloroflexi bacterium]|nr:MAG: fused response regulator/phosphatase [Chloroflexota bacterium]TMF30463.1 MAG: fused response regulator/phosphatase [Chloroflexota bacterium]
MAVGTERVLVVDDDEPLAKVMARVLRSRGFECDFALTGSEARRLLETKDYAVALLDVRLPDESGYGLLEELRATRPNTAVVMISGVDDPELGKAALEHGAFAYHVKPVGATQLYLLVVNNLQRRSLEMDHRASLDRLEGMVAERVDQMRRAAELQAGMLPASPLKEDGFEVAAHLTPAREISGDFYDWYRATNGRLAVTLGDVMGKGLPASLMMATARAALRGASEVEPLEAGIKQAAGVMSAALEVNHAYVTVFHCKFDPRTGSVEYVDAGHGHARLLRGATGQELLPQRSAPIGIFPDTQFLVGRATLEPGDSLVVFSDGLLDLRPDLATKDVQLPSDARRAATAQEMVDILAHGAREKELFDDVTVLALKRL